jgi:uncharacterized protein
MATDTQVLTVAIDERRTVSALLLAPEEPIAAFVFAHGAGAGMQHRFMESMSQELARRRIATFRYQFPYMQQGLKRPDSPAIAQHVVRAAVNEAAGRLDGIPLFAGGKSFGGRMTSQAQAAAPLPGVLGLVFVGFPLHPLGKPSISRADHLDAVRVPMLFLQGTRDGLADPALVRDVVCRLGDHAALVTFEDADHAFHVRLKSGSSDEAVMRGLADAMSEWMAGIAAARLASVRETDRAVP